MRCASVSPLYLRSDIATPNLQLACNYCLRYTSRV
nr:MAG TPA: hypothetical protein [Caudoviricetes sp.]